MLQIWGWSAREFVLSHFKIMYYYLISNLVITYNTFAAKMQSDTGEMTTTNLTLPT